MCEMSREVTRIRTFPPPQRAFLAFYLSEERHALSHVDWLAALLQQLLHFKAEESVASCKEVIGILEPLQVEIKACKKIGAPVLLTLAVISVLRSEIRAREKVVSVRGRGGGRGR